MLIASKLLGYFLVHNTILHGETCQQSGILSKFNSKKSWTVSAEDQYLPAYFKGLWTSILEKVTTEGFILLRCVKQCPDVMTSDLFDFDVDSSDPGLLSDMEKTSSDEKRKDGIHLGSPTTSNLF